MYILKWGNTDLNFQIEFVELLLGRTDIEVNHVEGNNCSALMIACMHGYVQVGGGEG